MKIFKHLKLLLPIAAAMAIAGFAIADHHEGKAEDKKETIKALLVTGEGYHDYENQKTILTDGISERLDIDWTIMHHKTMAECKKDLSKKGWADDYDIVVYNICHAKEADTSFIDSVAAVHEAGKPAVVIHCTLHSFHWNVKAEKGDEDKKTWVKLLGVRSQRHGPKSPIDVKKVKPDHPILKDLPDNWKTPQGELYYIEDVLDTATPLATGTHAKQKKPQVCIWTNQYGKGRIFGTSIGHHNSTMKSKEYLDLVANGITWALGKDEMDAEAKKDADEPEMKAETEKAAKAMEKAETKKLEKVAE